jgi:hypothetical protein
MKIIYPLIMSLVLVGCASAGKTDLTKSELRTVNAIVAKCPKAEHTGVTQAPGYVVMVPHDTVVVFAENGESFTVCKTPGGWKVMHWELPGRPIVALPK